MKRQRERRTGWTEGIDNRFWPSRVSVACDLEEGMWRWVEQSGGGKWGEHGTRDEKEETTNLDRKSTWAMKGK